MCQRRFAILVSVAVIFLLQLPGPTATPWGGWRNIGSEISRGLSQAGREIESAAAKVASETSNIVNEGHKEVKNFAQSIESAVAKKRDPEPDPEEVPVVSPTFAPRVPVLLGCPPLADPTLDVICLKDGRVNCGQVMERDTVAKITCKSQYKLPEPYPGYTDVSCTSGFTWSRPLFKCLPDCGKRNSPSKMSRGVKVPQLELPWTIGVYTSNQNGFYDQICSGSLITADLVITAASCFWDHEAGSKSSAANFKILAGSFDRQWPTSEEEVAIQKRDVKDVHIHERFLGRTRRLGYNIAIVRLTEPFILTKTVNVVCMDWNPRQQNVEENALKARNNGLVSSWGNASTNASSAFNIPVDIPYISALSCSDTIEDEVQDYLTPDKVCGGSNEDMVVCPQDTGAGYAFPLDMVQGKRYFLRGVASAPLAVNAVNAANCDTQKLSIFTYLSAHSKWVNKIVFGQ